jgi:FixJ family two-component response regulator
MNIISQQRSVMESGEAVGMTVWKTQWFAPLLTISPGETYSLSDAEIAVAAAQSGSFDFLNRPEENIYTLEDGQEL